MAANLSKLPEDWHGFVPQKVISILFVLINPGELLKKLFHIPIAERFTP